LYHGQVAEEPDEARKLAMELDRPQAIKDIQGAVNYLIARDDVTPKKAGVVGFCMGGGLSAMMAYQGKNVGAAVIYYGNVRDLSTDEVVSQVSVPLMGNFGEADQGIPVDTVEAAEAKLKELGKTADFYIYPGAPHAFFNDDRPHIYHEEAAKHSWQRTLSWFRQHLK
jgi:carboxymethylenebutenolidase